MNYRRNERKKFIVWLGIAICAIVLAVGMVMVAQAIGNNEGYRMIRVIETNGSVSVVKDGIEYQAYPGMLLQEGHAIVVAGSSYARLALDDDKYVKVEAGSRVVFETLGMMGSGKTAMKLERGSLTAELVSPLTEGQEFVVNTPNAVLAVRGTFFRVDLTMDKKGEVLANVMTYGGKVATKRVFPSGETEEEEVLVEAGYKTAINMDAVDTVYVVQKATEEDADVPSAGETVVPIHREEISDDDLVDIYFAAENGHELFVTVEEAKGDIESREINLEEKTSVYQLTEEVIKQENAQENGSVEETIVLDAIVFADDSKPLEMAPVEEKKEIESAGQTMQPAEDTVQQMATLVDGPPTEKVSVHTHTEVTSQKEATCTTDGAIIVSCSSCGEVLSQTSIPATGHVEKVAQVAATCTEDGSQVVSCSACGNVLSSATLPKLGHTMQVVETQPTCTQAGAVVSTCSVCGQVERVTGKAALGHTEVTESKSASCSSSGYKKISCSTCGEILSETVIAASGHTFTEFITVEPTCEGTGMMELQCECGYFETQSVAATGHDYVEVIDDPTDSSNGSKYDSCQNCGETANEEMVLAISNMNFPDAAFCTFIETSYNRDGHVGLTKAEIAAVTSMTIPPDVTAVNLAGINYFTALETLTVQSTSLQELDVSMNPTLSALNVMDATGLRMLNCSYTSIELLATTDLSELESILAVNCTKLETITAGACGVLASLDASGCTLLDHVDLAGDELLTDLNLTGDTALTVLSVNGCLALPSLDVSFATQLKSLEVNSCWEMTGLNISNTSLTAIVIDDVPKLQTLDVSGTPLEILDVPNSSTLRSITAQNCTKMTAMAAEACEALETVDASGATLMSYASFVGCEQLQTVNMSGNVGLAYLYLQDCTSLTSVNVTNCGGGGMFCVYTRGTGISATDTSAFNNTYDASYMMINSTD